MCLLKCWLVFQNEFSKMLQERKKKRKRDLQLSGHLKRKAYLCHQLKLGRNTASKVINVCYVHKWYTNK